MSDFRRQIKRLRADGYTHRAIAEELGISRYQVGKVLIPNFLEKERKKRRRYESNKRARERECLSVESVKSLMQSTHTSRINQEIREDAAKRMAEIPKDTRTFTQRFFGDPLPGRSALDKKRMAEAMA